MASSVRISASNSATFSFKALTFSSGNIKLMLASRGIALRNEPPLNCVSSNAKSSAFSNRKRANNLLALPRPK